MGRRDREEHKVTAEDAAPSLPPSQVEQLSSVDNGALHINKVELSKRARRIASHLGAFEENWIAQLIASIRRFIEQICRAFLPARYFSNQATNPSALGQETGPLPSLSETEDEYVVKGLPDTTLERIHHTVSEMVDAVSGDGLSDSLKTALNMPELGQRQIFRVLLQQNFSDTEQASEMCAALQGEIEKKVALFANVNDLDAKEVVNILRKEIERGEGFLIKRADPNGEIRSYIDELRRVESVLTGLTEARGMICACAIDSGAYTHEALVELVEQAGLETTFLSRHESVAMRSEPKAQAEDNRVASIEEYRAKVTSSFEGEGKPDKEHISESSALTHLALAKFVEQGAIPKAEAEKLLSAAIPEAALNEEMEFEPDVQADELDSFFKQHNAAKLTPK